LDSLKHKDSFIHISFWCCHISWQNYLCQNLRAHSRSHFPNISKISSYIRLLYLYRPSTFSLKNPAKWKFSKFRKGK